MHPLLRVGPRDSLPATLAPRVPGPCARAQLEADRPGLLLARAETAPPLRASAEPRGKRVSDARPPDDRPAAHRRTQRAPPSGAVPPTRAPSEGHDGLEVPAHLHVYSPAALALYQELDGAQRQLEADIASALAAASAKARANDDALSPTVLACASFACAHSFAHPPAIGSQAGTTKEEAMSRKMLPSLRSRWMTFLPCMYTMPSSSCIM